MTPDFPQATTHVTPGGSYTLERPRETFPSKTFYQELSLTDSRGETFCVLLPKLTTENIKDKKQTISQRVKQNESENLSKDLIFSEIRPTASNKRKRSVLASAIGYCCWKYQYQPRTSESVAPL